MCDMFRPVFDATDGVDGRVSIEVDPSLGADTESTVEMARKLWAEVDRPNAFIKIPATVEGLTAISEVLADGISINVTLNFSLDRYRGVMNAFLTGLEQAREAGKDLSTIHSVASFFVSRVDSEVDQQLDAIGTHEALALRGKAGLANARLVYQAFEEVFATPRYEPGRRRRSRPAPAMGLHRRKGPGLPRHPLRRWSGGTEGRQRDAAQNHGSHR